MRSSGTHFTRPLVFSPLFKERIWGGRRLEALFGKKLPPAVPIGESWELVDRPGDQSVVREGPCAGRTLHELWTNHRADVFGQMADRPRFPLLLKLLDAQARLSLQVHPPANVAEELRGECKTEFWYIAHAEPRAELYVGLKRGTTRAQFESALAAGDAENLTHRVAVRTGDAMFLPSGRLHAIGAGNIIVEIQENSDTTYRVFDWNRTDERGQPRALHIAESLRSIDFDDLEPGLNEAAGERLVENPIFAVERWELNEPRSLATSGRFAIVVCVRGAVVCEEVELRAGEVFLLPAAMPQAVLRPTAPGAMLLRITAGSALCA